MKTQSFSKCGFSRIASFSLVLFVLALSLAPEVFACHQKRGEPMPHGKQTSCDDGGDLFPSNPEYTEAWFEDLFISVLPQVFARSPNSDYSGGDYLADQPSATEIRITTNSLSKTVVSGKRFGDLCQVMDDTANGNGPYEGFPDTFNFGWTDNCTDGECAIEISMSFSGGVSDLTTGLSDRLEIVMFASAKSDDLMNMDEPFLAPQNIKTTAMELDFKKPGSVRSLVRCRLTPQGSGAPTLNTLP